MKKGLSFFLAFAGLLLSATAQDIKSPEEYLGYESGTQFTMHSQALSYFKYLANNSDNIKYLKYGNTYEGRELGLAFISSAENIKNLEKLRKANLINIGMIEGETDIKQIPFVWLSYNVHGNESVGMEAAIKTIHLLATKSYEGVEEWLKECVIIIDPCLNPDGRELYASRYRRSQSLNPNSNPDDWEHHQGWPSARLNHYLFDLNRDWVWQTQAETKQRIALYNKYMPHVHADFHEMGSGSTFFFAPGADPWHEVITPWQHEFHKLAGKSNADLFDEKYKLYFTKESFDLFCPSFGDTWPLFNGAMGFTYEQGGGGFAGLSIAREAGDSLTLMNRIEGHFLAGIATIKVSYENRTKLITEFNNFFKSGLSKPVFEYESVIIKGDNEESAISSLLDLLNKNQIKYSLAGDAGKKFEAFDYLANKEGEVRITEGDILISARQPQSHLVKVLFEPDSEYTDSLSYDLTAWALPYVYKLKAFALHDKITEKEGKVLASPPEYKAVSTKPYAYIIDWQGFNEVKILASLLKENFKVRNMMKPFSIDNKDFNRGSLIIARGDNMHLKAKFDDRIIEIVNKYGVIPLAVETGMMDKGRDMGSNYSKLASKPDIAIIGGKGVSSGSFGELWYFLERDLDYPVTVIGTDYMSSVDLKKYDIILLPSGSYPDQKEQLVSYVKEGGRLLAFEKSVSIFATDKTTSLFKAVEARKKEKEKKDEKIKSDDPTHLKKFENRRRESLKDRSAGSIYRVSLDETHPYTFGLGKEWFIMKRGANYPFLAKGNNIGYILDNDPVAGFAGSKFKKEVNNTIIIASEKIGKGEVVYITDNPYYRAYWKSGRVLLGNILFR